MLNQLYKYRFETFLTSQLFILFGSLFFPQDFYEHTLLPILYLTSIAAGILMISKWKKLMWLFVGLFVITALIFSSDAILKFQNTKTLLIRLSIYFIFYFFVTWNIIQQVWRAKKVTKNVIIGLISGYVSLGFLAFFLFMSIELITPNSFQIGLINSNEIQAKPDNILYYAYITLLTIGYGEIIPTTAIAQKAAILVGLIGQFYMVIITAVVIEKYIRHSAKK
jgi:voltage-gated potassium channel Kch|tara:strand:- start:197 stop:865 length:669 start_codon:yes stop_codon:yes gene_type:complete